MSKLKDKRWYYSQVVSATEKTTPADGIDGLPKPDSDIYKGITSDSKLDLTLELQDMFGNRAGNLIADLEVELGFSDEIIGISGWPGVNSSYIIRKEGGNSKLEISLSFNKAAYIPSDNTSSSTCVEMAKEHLKIYRKVYYQLTNSYTEFDIQSSLGTVTETSADIKNSLTLFAEEIYLFLKNISATDFITEKNDFTTLQQIIDYTPDDSNINVKSDLSFNDILRENDRFNFKPDTVITLPVYHFIEKDSGVTIATIKDPSLDMETFCYENSTALLNPGKELSSETQTLTVTEGQSATDAADILYPIEENKVKKLFEAFLNEADLFAEGSRIFTKYETYKTAAGKTLNELAFDRKVEATEIAELNKDVTDSLDSSLMFKIPLELSSEIPENNVCTISGTANCNSNNEKIFPLTVELVIKRDENSIDPDFKGNSSVSESRSLITPLYKGEKITNENGEEIENKNLTLKPFAENFETAFPDFKIATGKSKKGRAGGKDETVYVVNFSDSGYNFEIKKEGDKNKEPGFFALHPLSSRLLSKSDVELDNYVPGVGVSDKKELHSFRAVDLDKWMNEFLDSVDLMLTPGYAVKLSTVMYTKENDDESKGESEIALNTLVDIKKKLAQDISSRMDAILMKDMNPGTNAITEAKDSLKEQLLTELARAYETDSMIQVPFTVNSSDPEVESPIKDPRVSCKLVSNTSSKNYSFSQDEIALENKGGTSTGTFMFDVKPGKEDEEENFSMNLGVNVTGISYETIDEDGCEDTTHLSFITPLSALEIGDTMVPVPLRSYPTPPALMSQKGESSLENPDPDQVITSGEVVTAIEKAKSWDYEVIYRDRVAAQDRIKLSVDFNTVDKLTVIEDQDLDVTELAGIFSEFIGLEKGEHVRLYKLILNYITEGKTERDDTIENLLGVKDDEDDSEEIMRYHSIMREKLYKIINRLGVRKYPERLKLFKGLAQFKTIYSDLKKDLDSGDANKFKTAADAYIKTALSITAPADGNFENSIYLKPTDKAEYKIEIEEEPEESGRFILRATEEYQIEDILTSIDVRTVGKSESFKPMTKRDDGITYDYPVVEQNPKKYNPFDNTLEYRFCFESRDVIFNQNAWAGVSVTRNEELDFEEKKLSINPHFIYHTPMVHFPSRMTPCIRVEHIVNIKDSKTVADEGYLDEAHSKLKKDLAKMFAILFTKKKKDDNVEEEETKENEKAGMKIKLSCRYGYNISEKEDSLTTFVPILLIPEYIFDGDEDGLQAHYDALSDELAQKLHGWYSINQPSTTNSAYYFDVCVFSSLDMDVTHPILELKNLRYDLSETAAEQDKPDNA